MDPSHSTTRAGITGAALTVRVTEHTKTRSVKERVIDCHCFVISRQLDDLGVDQDGEKVRFSFRPSRVESIRESMDSDEPSKEESLVFFKSGVSYIVDIGYDKLYKLLFGPQE